MTAKASPSPRQMDVLQFVARYHAATRGMSPTQREIGQGTGIKLQGNVQKVLDALERKGLIRRNRGRHRSIRILCRLPGWPAEGLHLGRDFVSIGKSIASMNNRPVDRAGFACLPRAYRDQFENCDVAHMTSDQISALRSERPER